MVPWYHGTFGTVFTTYGTVGTYLRYQQVRYRSRPILSGYLTRINETRIVKLRYSRYRTVGTYGTVGKVGPQLDSESYGTVGTYGQEPTVPSHGM